MKSWYQIKSMNNDVLEISIHDEIGLWGISAADFIADLKRHPNARSINLSIHSPGGSMFDGFAMYNALKSHPAKVHAHVVGLAASMATVVLMAGDTITMPKNAFLMIHNPSGGAFGGSDDLRDMADLMDKLRASAMSIYLQRTGMDEADLSEMLDAESWMDGAQAMEKGFVDTLTDEVEVAAKTNTFDKYFKSMPINHQYDLTNIKNERDLEKRLRDSGLSKKLASGLASQAKTIFQRDAEPVDLEKLSNALNKLQTNLEDT